VSALAGDGAIPLPIVAEAEARAAVERMQQATLLALDTEGDGMFRYRARLCTVQLADARDVYVFDTLAVAPSPLFARLLGASGPEKIVHDLSFDARVLFAHGIVLGNVFDTSIAARFLGLKSTGLSTLLMQHFEINLPKHKQQADWGARPLDDEALSYLGDDVRHLEKLATLLLEQVRARDIEPEVREECAYMLGEAQVKERVEAPWLRIKGVGQKAPHERARLYHLCDERERVAQELDLPPGRVIANDLLVRLAELDFKTAEELNARLPNRVAPFVERLWQAYERGNAAGDAPFDDVQRVAPRPPSHFEIDQKKRRRKALMEFREREATARAVDPQVVLPGHCLSDMVELDALNPESLASVRGFGACRVTRYATRLVSELTEHW
jgi:ribonuclease D